MPPKPALAAPGSSNIAIHQAYALELSPTPRPNSYPSHVHRFVNEPTLTESLPELADESFVAVDKNLLRVSLLGFGAAALLVLVAAVLLFRLTEAPWWLPVAGGGGLIALIGLMAVLRVLEVRNIAYQVRTHDISYRSGVLVKTVSSVPFVRVQHARIRQGPIHRRFGLASLEVSSAGPDLQIHGLQTDTAERLKVLVVQRAGDLVEGE